MLRLIHIAAIFALAAAPLHAEGPRFVQDQFCISFFIEPPVDEQAEMRYKELADANFNVMMGVYAAKTPEQLRQQVALCEKLGMKAILVSAGLPDAELPNDEHVWGYFIRDEPSASDFPALRKRVEELRAARPGKLGYINLFPSYCDLERLGTPTYEEHVRQFLEVVQPDVLCMDHYPMMRPELDSRDQYLADLDVMRRCALERAIPWWNYFNAMPFGPHKDPTEAQLRWQAFSSVAYGAKGVLYFCYWTPQGKEFERGGAIITAEGKKTRHYGQAQRINAVLKAWGPTLMKLKSESAKSIFGGGTSAGTLNGTPIRGLSEGRYVMGVLRHEDGRRAVVLVNHDTDYTQWPTVHFDVPDAEVIEVDPVSGAEAPLADDSPALPGLQVSFDAGDARLFLLPAQPAAPVSK